MGKLNGHLGIVLLLACGTGCTGTGPEMEAPGTEEQAAESQYDRRALAAFEFRRIAGAYGWVGIPILVACDDSSRLMYTYRHLLDGWQPWTEIPGGGGCIGVPTVVKWVNDGGNDSAAIYARFDDNHVWEAWLPDLTRVEYVFYWADISVASGFPYPVTDSPILADSGDAWDVSIVVKAGNTTPQSLYTFDWQDGAWSYRKVYSAGSTAIKTENVVSTRGHQSPSGYAYIAGRGYAAGSPEATAWFARRQGSLTSPYNRVSSYDVPFGVSGTPAVLIPAGQESFETHYARFGSSLNYRRMLPGASSWQSFSTCYPAGSPRTATMSSGDGRFVGFIRGGETSSVSNDLLRVTGSSGGCTSLGGTLYSGPTPIEYAQFDYTWTAAAYKGANNEVYFYNPVEDVHERVPGITLP